MSRKTVIFGILFLCALVSCRSVEMELLPTETDNTEQIPDVEGEDGETEEETPALPEPPAEEPLQPGPVDPQEGEIVITASKTAETYCSWKIAGESFSLFRGQSVSYGNYRQGGELAGEGRTATFIGKAPDESGKYTAICPAITSGNALKYNISFANQSGLADGAKEYMYSTVEYSKGSALESIDFKPLTARLKLVLDFPESGTASGTILSGGGLVTSADVSPMNDRFSTAPATTGDISIDGTFETSSGTELYIYQPYTYEPYIKALSGELTVISFVGGRRFIGSVQMDHRLEAGRQYVINVTMAHKEDTTVETASLVEVKNRKLYVNGEEFFVKGVDYNGTNTKLGDDYDDFTVASGINAVRTYSLVDVGYNNQQERLARLNSMAKKGLYINFGISINEARKSEWTEEIIKMRVDELLTYNKEIFSCPNILMWTIGNEVEMGSYPLTDADVKGKLIRCFQCINRMSQAIKANDGYRRPTTIAMAGYEAEVLALLLEHAPDLDIVMFNSYPPNVYNLHTLLMNDPNWVRAGKPYMISEYGPVGTWENDCPRTIYNGEWGKVIEGSGTEKAEDYRRIHTECIEAYKNDGCIGGYAFLWGWQSHGAVPTYYAMIDEFEDYALPSTDAMAECFGVTVPTSEKAPVVSTKNDMTINGKVPGDNLELTAGAEFTAKVTASSPAGRSLVYDWVLIEDRYLSNETMGKDVVLYERTSGTTNSITLNAPQTAGFYRLLVYPRDETIRKTGFASFPFKVN